MKVLVLDCLKRDSDKQSKLFYDKFTEGIKTAGGEVKYINIYDLDIKPCFSCTTQYSFRYEDKCRCDDDMNKLYPEFRNSDIWVFFAHVNTNGSTEYLKNLLDRMEPLFQPTYGMDNSDISSFPDVKMNGKMILVSSYDRDAGSIARNISEYIDSIGLLFAKHTPGNILFNQENSDISRLEHFFNAGKSLIENASN